MPTTDDTITLQIPNVTDSPLHIDLKHPPSTLIQDIKKHLEKSHQDLISAFKNRVPIKALVRGRATLLDQTLTALWRIQSWPEEPVALLAVGGYGRAELHPQSDIDLLLLHQTESPSDALNQAITQFFAALWDIGVEVGHSVRSIDECRTQALGDVTIASNLLDTRFLVGDRALLDELHRSLDTPDYWPIDTFFAAKQKEQTERHNKHHNTEYNLEPDIKAAPGGLRDIHMIAWIAKKHFKSTSLSALLQADFLTEDEYEELRRCRSFLWRLRFGLHLHTRRDDNRLLFDYQKSIADILDYQDSTGQRAVERMMKDYYRCALTISTLNELVLNHFQDTLLDADQNSPTHPLNGSFQLRGQLLEIAHDQVFTEHPEALLEIFVLLASDLHFKGISPQTVRLIRQESNRLIDDAYRNNPKHHALFLKLLRSPHHLFSTLNKMKRYGVLNRYIPAFEAIIGQMQFDLFHIYTVDAHTLRVIKNLRMFRYSQTLESHPIASQLFHQFEKIEILYLAALFHDLAKGRGGDHSELGAVDAKAFCTLHGLEETDADLVAWLVEQHLLMSTTAQKHDLYDPDVIQTFANKVGTVDRLNHLYTLTVADINATNPKLWNAWRAELLSRLYTVTKQLLLSDAEPLKKSEQRLQAQSIALNYLASDNENLDAAKQLWARFGEEYFLKESPENIAWHTQSILAHQPSKDPLVTIKFLHAPNTTPLLHLFVYTQDRPNLFFDTVATLDRLGLTVLDAAINLSDDGLSLDHYVAQIDTTSTLSELPNPSQHVQNAITDAITNASPTKIRQLRLPNKLRSFDVETQVSIENSDNNHTEVTVKTLDRPGLLAKVAEFFSRSGFDVHNAKIVTLGEKAEDTFAITDQDGSAITDPEACEQLKKNLIEHLLI